MSVAGGGQLGLDILFNIWYYQLYKAALKGDEISLDLFLTSKIGATENINGRRVAGKIDDRFGFLSLLRKRLRETRQMLYISSNPEHDEKVSDWFQNTVEALEKEGICFEKSILINGQNAHMLEKLVAQADVIFLSGGHLPTQNLFFQEIRLRDILAGFDGIIVAQSAGSMNCAETVYVCPELPGESIAPDFERFRPGLGLTDINIIPHYDHNSDLLLDGRRFYEDVVRPDSFKIPIYLLTDGSYFYIHGGRAQLVGEAYLFYQGEARPLKNYSKAPPCFSAPGGVQYTKTYKGAADMTKEETRINAGVLFAPGDPELVAIKLRTHNLNVDFNMTHEDEYEKRDRLLHEIIGEFGEGGRIQGPIAFHYGQHTKIGKRFFANFNFTVQDDGEVTIGDDCNFGPNVTIVTPIHPMLPGERRELYDAEGNPKHLCWAKPVHIGNDCWFGASVTVCPGVTIGDGCVIGAGSVVTRDIPPNSFAAGVPCRVIREITTQDSVENMPEILGGYSAHKPE